jgi:alkane 1-monooxygenase
LIAAILLVFGWMAMLLFLVTAAIGITLLEVINYVEHYGLQRQEISKGNYEKVQPYHSWNSDHSLGRIILFELTRHADHHYKASRKYQTLRHFDHSPQLPSGYPAMMLLSIIPPMWFQVMNPRVRAVKTSSN